MRIYVLPFLVAVMTATAARANSTDSREAFEEGVLLYKKGEYTKAAASFRESYHLMPNWKLFYNIGQCEAAAEHYVLAMEAFTKFLAKGGDEIDEERRKEVEGELNQLQSRQFFMEGTLLFEKEDYVKAAAAFRKAYHLNPNWKVFYNIAQSEAAARHYGRAMEAFEQYLALGGDDIGEERRGEVESELDRLQRLVGFVDLSAPSGARIFVDDNERGIAPLPGSLMIAAGVVHDLKVVHEGNVLLVRKIQVSGRQSVPVIVQSDDSNSPVEQTPAQKKVTTEAAVSKQHESADFSANPRILTQAKWRQKLMPVSISLMATGGGALIAGLITGAVALKRSNDLREPCEDRGCLPEYHDKNDSVGNLAKASNVLLISSTGLAMTGAVLFIFVKKSFGEEQVMTLAPGIVSNMAWVAVMGRF